MFRRYNDLLTSQLSRMPSSMPTRGLYPKSCSAFLPVMYLVPQASNTLPPLMVYGIPSNQATHSAMYPTVTAKLPGIWTSKGGWCPKCAQIARHRSRKVIGSLFEMKIAWPAAVFEPMRFSAARTWASATLVTYVTSQRFSPVVLVKRRFDVSVEDQMFSNLPDPIIKGVSPLAMQECIDGTS